MQDVSAALYPVHRLLSWQRAPPPSLSLNALPADILFEITSYFNTLSDVLQLSLVSSAVYAKTISAIYGAVELQGPAQCEATLRMLGRCPAIARHVRKLVVRPEKELPRRPRPQTKEWDVAGDISRIVAHAAKHLHDLHVFEWDGEDMLPDDRMWSELQRRCPQLRHIGTTLGCFLPRPTSYLFKFSGLEGFSLIFKDGFYAHQLHLASRESAPVFSRLWDMLVQRCPYLESLAIAGTSFESSDVFPLYRIRWPCLRRLTVGDVFPGNLAPPGQMGFHPFVDFIERHPTLEGLHLLGHSDIHHLDLARLEDDAVPHLTEFTGSLDHLRALISRGQGQGAGANANAQVLWGAQWGQHVPLGDTSLAKTLKRLCLPEPMQLRELTPLSISRVLTDLTALTSLTITFALHSGYDSNGVFRTIVSSCPQLLHLDLTCTSKPSFYLDTFSRSVKKLARLRSLNLTIVKFHGEEAMHVGAARIALANPRVARFTINYIPAHAPSIPLPPLLETGAFELLCDIHGLPVNLYVSEWRAVLSGGGGGGVIWRSMVSAAMLLGIGVGTGWRRSHNGWTRRWACELRHSGHPDVTQKGMCELLLERSQAGEEARLLFLCLGLLLLAMWGVVWRASGYVASNA
ncbi:uncharacterized protein C8Q71DRAFT_515344 [Rhodofomes roseus]|uniref:F-box domain-containing protein n=1 Tax=Rhodofomes roseus TaxID=34475 RepID=A0ABQ8KMF2_9APHY|nr:uncharacterized protein C8Q71DRAFT_515344 [Rhodofomes roseus]KAH9839509.1 hypothetical protein C8Q71DRAFT_515344 [Rhodofomes roseus]